MQATNWPGAQIIFELWAWKNRDKRKKIEENKDLFVELILQS